MDSEPAGTAAKKPRHEDAEWLNHHLEKFRDVGMAWPPCWHSLDDDLTHAFDKARIPRRQQEIVLYWNAQHEGKSEETVIDLTPTIDWEVNTIGFAPCIVSSSVLWMRQAQRLVHGAEALMMQGFPSNVMNEPQLWPSRFLMTMAGNAFNSWHIIPNFFAVLALSIATSHSVSFGKGKLSHCI